ncbi:MAG: OPT/YSL family transporter [Coriobacteriales bacterium]|jgi:uncharacterized oligopeptide transporter (OPT) family protein|nr:OPT/YSL family transporter [Coriobacteriales bacterium]
MQNFTLRGVVIGAICALVISASSVYIALKLGALPWPIFFAVLLVLFLLKALGKRRRARGASIEEAGVSTTIVTSASMVAGGLAFTVPALYILGLKTPSFATVSLCAIVGVMLGALACALYRGYFIERSKLPYPIGLGAARTLRAGDEGGHKAHLLFGSAAFAALFAFLRDGLGLIPSVINFGIKVPNALFGIYASPMSLAMGFLIAPTAALVWLGGGLAGLVCDVCWGKDVATSLGIGLMIGVGIGIIARMLYLFCRRRLGAWRHRRSGAAWGSGNLREAGSAGQSQILPRPVLVALIPLVLLLAGLWLGFGLKLELGAVLMVLVLVFLVFLMSAQATGQAGMNPMEVFAVIVVLSVGLIWQLGQLQAVLLAAVVAVAAGLTGDVFNDYKLGAEVGIAPRAQWCSQLIGGLIGALVGAAVIVLLTQVYGSACFGSGHSFIAAQAGVVATMIGGIPNLALFLGAALLGLILAAAGAPVMTLGLGVYLPFYMSLSVALGAGAHWLTKKLAPRFLAREGGTVVASGLLAGESIFGILAALVLLVSGAFAA